MTGDEEADESTTILQAAVPKQGATDTVHMVYASSQPEPGTAAPPQDEDRHGDEEVTTILQAPVEAEPEDRTTILQSPPEPPAADEERTTIVQAARASEPPPAPQAPPSDMTEIVPASEAASLLDAATGQGGAAMSGRAWFDQRLRDFTMALGQDQAGRKRTPQERQALAAAARDMIARVGTRSAARAEGWPADTVLQPDQLLVNTYFVRSLIARGGVGEIYRTRHRDLRTEHAIKILLPRYALDPTVLTLMLEEARLLQRVRHEAVVGCQGLLRDVDGRPMLVMDYLRGRTLSARLRDGPLGASELVILANRLAAGLAAIHAQGIVHQDLSPDNIILAEDSMGGATIIDFGLARMAGDTEDSHRNIDFAGKFSWSSPEQLSGRPASVDARSDLYSLGLVLAAAARGQRLDMGRDLESARAARHAVPKLDGIAEPMAGLLHHLLAPSKSIRLRAAGEVGDWLRVKKPGVLTRFFGRS